MMSRLWKFIFTQMWEVLKDNGNINDNNEKN